jgi:uncharacterized membrane protein YesL
VFIGGVILLVVGAFVMLGSMRARLKRWQDNKEAPPVVRKEINKFKLAFLVYDFCGVAMTAVGIWMVVR